jgi:hypothetical protein
MGKYDDIINLDRPKSRYPKMSMEKRGAIFSPFEALTGYEDKINESGKYREIKCEMSDEDIDKINTVLNILKKNDLVKINYYDNKDKRYKEVTGNIKKIDTYKKIIILNNNININFNDLRMIDIIPN